MISYFDAALTRLSIHYTGNKVKDESYRLSQKSLPIADEILSSLLMQYFYHPLKR